MRTVLIGLVKLYRLLLSPWVGGQCRFDLTCSQYTIEALERHGSLKGTYLGAARILRCQPWCEGGHDPVPETFQWAPWRHRPTQFPETGQVEVEGTDIARRHNSAPQSGTVRTSSSSTDGGPQSPSTSSH